QVMTIHKSKGQEFDEVYVAQLHTHGGSSHTSSLRFDRRWLPGDRPQYSLFGAPTLGFDEILDRDEQIDEAERVRTLYVAMTRAKKRLVMVGKWPATADALTTPSRASHVDLLMRRQELPESFESLLDECLATGSSAVDHGGARWRFPALDRAGAPQVEGDSGGLDRSERLEMRRRAEQLRIARLEAADRMNRPLSTSASAEAEVALTPLLEKSRQSSSEPRPAASSRLVGTAFHKIMENWDLDADPLEEWQSQKRAQIEWLEQSSIPSQRHFVLRQFEELVDRFAGSEIWQQFIAARDRVVGRELPVVVSPHHSSLGATGFVSGSIDLVLRDPGGSGLIVVDYKTDRVENEEELRRRAEAYQRQESLYATALKESLDLEVVPSCQLWFIWPDRLWQDGSSGDA
ncbi:MAG: PD-(D/E)XK nuclease family protein, partial [Acidobacteriota bacterium]